jgi:hypothetical protein
VRIQVGRDGLGSHGLVSDLGLDARGQLEINTSKDVVDGCTDDFGTSTSKVTSDVLHEKGLIWMKLR